MEPTPAEQFARVQRLVYVVTPILLLVLVVSVFVAPPLALLAFGGLIGMVIAWRQADKAAR